MWSRARRGCGGWRVLQARRMISSRPPPVSVSSAVNSMLLRSLRDHYLEVSKMTPPPVNHFSNLSISIYLYSHALSFLFIYYLKKKSIFPATNRRLGFSVVNSIYILCITEGEPSISILHYQRCARLRGSCAQAQLWQ